MLVRWRRRVDRAPWGSAGRPHSGGVQGPRRRAWTAPRPAAPGAGCGWAALLTEREGDRKVEGLCPVYSRELSAGPYFPSILNVTYSYRADDPAANPRDREARLGRPGGPVAVAEPVRCWTSNFDHRRAYRRPAARRWASFHAPAEFRPAPTFPNGKICFARLDFVAYFPIGKGRSSRFGAGPRSAPKPPNPSRTVR
jgi:hypothetical protein